MFKFLKNNLLWGQTFDTAFHSGMTFFGRYDGQALQEKRFHWRERLGKLRGLSPEEAVFRAFEDFADDYHQRNRGRPESDAEFLRIASALEYVAPYIDRDGKYHERSTFLSDRWRELLARSREQRDADKADRDAKLQEVLSHQFPIEEIEAAWQGLLKGETTSAAKSVFRGAYPRSSAHDIARKMIIPVRDVVFWAVVLRNNRMMEEQVLNDQHLYTSTYARSDPAKLHEPVATVVRLVQG